MRTVIFDFDGTIVDIQSKYRYVFHSVTGLNQDAQDFFWKLKKLGSKTDEILRRIPEIDLTEEKFLHLWRTNVETEEALSRDIVHQETIHTLDELSGRARVLLCTARQNDYMLHQELRALDIRKFFSDVLVTKQISSKLEIVLSFMEENDVVLDKSDWFVGDTMEDVLTGQCLGIRTCGVLSGLSPRKVFMALKIPPDEITESIIEFGQIF